MNNFLTRLIKINLHTNVYGFARTAFAISCLLTLLFNENNILWPPSLFSHPATSIYERCNFFFIFGHEYIYLAKLIAIVIMGIVISGYLPQITGVLHFYIAYSLSTSILPAEGGDQIAQIFTFLLIPICITDPRINHWTKPIERNEDPFVKIFISSFWLIIQLQSCVIYLFSSLGKLGAQEWTDGTAMYYWSNHWMFGFNNIFQPVFSILFKSKIIILCSTWLVLIGELILAGALFMGVKAKKNIFYMGIFFHFSIMVLLGLITFFFSMTGVLILYLLPIDRQINIKIPSLLKKGNKISNIPTIENSNL